MHALAPYNGLLGTPNLALPAVIVVMIWSTAPTAMILYLAGLQTISRGDTGSGGDRWREHLAAGAVDNLALAPAGDGTVDDICFSIRLSRTIRRCSLLTNGGPANATNVVGLMVFGHATQLGGMSGGLSGDGIGSAQGWILALFTALVALVQLRLFRSRT